MVTQLVKRKAIEQTFKNSKRYDELEKYRLARNWAKNHVIINAAYSTPFSEIHSNYLNFLDTYLKNEQLEVKKRKQFQSNELGFFLKNYAAEQDSGQEVLFYTSRSFQGMIYHGLGIKV